ncbi:WbuC family cupin fold metalloprotein [Providencia sp. R1]|uniref:WbuC family cupin fold metalloprotein n=1 Tax=Morganellaceae TaxID=1903414 RepID=UPI001121F53C|nr:MULTISPECIES: WbuC family cupin fold metalloprotein [Morganellaceae]EJD6662567.1 WbuC family cupin fold metalloprotein [Providencia rettgeri]MBQ0307581.1 WbuC family cupin fold metalloprotein [Providencia rettgeri]MDT7048277.1 WbuC family cupin fold metalloprotein [Providencia stuartii]QHD94443.1 cupin fold metalloprotein, WbuC family [Proteus terrae subsp. cibarius]QJW49719.1 WbuC family cupin fold metalloprotein [Proteus terrae subsp. cibarius]
MRILDKQFLTSLECSAVTSPRKRAHLNLHNSFEEKVQRLFIALTKGSYVKPHYHELPHQWEMFVVMEGVVEVVIYSKDGQEKQRLLVGDGQSCKAIEIQPMDIHSVACISNNALMLEIKEGPFDPATGKVAVNFSTK